MYIAILLLQAALDANYEVKKKNTFQMDGGAWKERCAN